MRKSLSMYNRLTVCLVFVSQFVFLLGYYSYVSPKNDIKYEIPKASRFATDLSVCGEMEITIADHIYSLVGTSFESFIDLSPEEGLLYSMLLNHTNSAGIAILVERNEYSKYLSMNIGHESVRKDKSIVGVVAPFNLRNLQENIEQYKQTYETSVQYLPSNCPSFAFFRFLSVDHTSEAWVYFINFSNLIELCQSKVFFDSNSPQLLAVIGELLINAGYQVSATFLCKYCDDTNMKPMIRVLLTAEKEKVFQCVNENENCAFLFHEKLKYNSKSFLTSLENIVSDAVDIPVEPSECEGGEGFINPIISTRVSFHDVLLPDIPSWSCILRFLRFNKSISEDMERHLLDLVLNVWNRESSDVAERHLLSHMYCYSWLKKIVHIFDLFILQKGLLSNILEFCPNFSSLEELIDNLHSATALLPKCATFVMVDSTWQHQRYMKKYENILSYNRLESEKKKAINDLNSYISAVDVPNLGPNLNGVIHGDLTIRPYSLYQEETLPLSSPWSLYYDVGNSSQGDSPWVDSVRKYQIILKSWQNPPEKAANFRSCQTAKFLVYEPLSEFYGVGAIIDQVAAAMQYALCMNRIFILAPKVNGTLAKYSSVGCHLEENPFVCYFQPLSTCFLSDNEVNQAFQSTDGEGFDSDPLMSERILVLRGLPEKGSCAKILLQLSPNSPIYDDESNGISIDEASTRWKDSWYTNNVFPRRRLAKYNPRFEQYSIERQRHLSLLLPYLFRPKASFLDHVSRSIGYSLTSPHPNFATGYISEIETSSSKDGTKRERSFLPFGRQSFPTDYIVIHLRYPHHDLIAPHTLNEFEKKKFVQSSKFWQRKFDTGANHFEMYEQPTYKDVMDIVQRRFPDIKDIVVITESFGILGFIIREYPQYNFHHMDFHYDSKFEVASSTFWKNDNNLVEQYPDAEIVRYQASNLFKSVFTEFSLIENARGGVGMAFSHGSKFLEKWLLTVDGNKPFYMAGKDDTFMHADDGFWFPPNIIYGRQPLPHGRDFIHYKYLRSHAQSIDLYRHLPTLRKYAALSGTRTILECGVRDTFSSWALAQGLLDQNLFPPVAAKPKHFAVDLARSPLISIYAHHADLAGIAYQFFEGSDLDVEISETVDLLFIDTLHVYGQLIRELRRFAPLTRRHIILHDTSVDGEFGEVLRMGYNVETMVNDTQMPREELVVGLWPAIMDFLQSTISGGTHWRLKERYVSNNGLTILERIDNSSLIEI